MSEWWTYRFSDFVLFSPRVYYRLFELHNQALWPSQLLSVALGLAILFVLLRPTRGRHRIVPALLGALWIWVAWAFLWERYATINWASAYVAPVFALQGLALLWFGTVRKCLAFAQRGNLRDDVGRALFAGALIGYPLLAPLMGRPWFAAEIFGIAPDPTAVGTLAVLALADGRMRWLLLLVPCLWCAISGATLWTMGAGGFFVPPLSALIAVGSALAGNQRR